MNLAHVYTIITFPKKSHDPFSNTFITILDCQQDNNHIIQDIVSDLRLMIFLLQEAYKKC